MEAPRRWFPGPGWAGEAAVLAAAAALLVAALAGPAAGPARAQTEATPVSECQVLDQAGVYELATNLSARTGPCIRVAASDVAFRGAGRAIQGVGGPGSAGVLVDAQVDPVNVTVADVTVEDWAGAGVRVRGASDVSVEGVVVRNASMAGVHVAAADDVALRDSLLEAGGDGVLAWEDPANLTVDGVEAAGNDGAGLNLSRVHGLEVLRSEVRDNGWTGVRLDGVRDGRLEDVTVTGSGAWDLEAAGGDPLDATGLHLADETADAALRDARLRSVASPAPTPDGYRDLGRFVAWEAAGGTPWLNLTARYGTGEVDAYQEDTVRLWRWDGASWEEVPGWNRVEADAGRVTANASEPGTLAPLVDEDVAPPTTEADVPASWRPGPVNVTLSATDGESGVRSTLYRVDGGSWTTYDGPFPVTGEGLHEVEYASTDREGNQETTQAATVGVDGTAPNTTVSLEGNATDWGGLEPPVQVSLEAADALSGVEATTYRLEGGPNRSYDGPFPVRERGNHTLTYWSRDAAGNREVAGEASVPVAFASPPSTRLEVTPATPDGANGWYRTRPSLQIVPNVSDATPRYRLDGGPAREGATVEDLPAGRHVVTYRSTAPLRPGEEPANATLRWDPEPPSLGAPTVTTPDPEPGGTTRVQVQAEDAHSGLATVVARVQGPGSDRTVALEPAGDGTWAGRFQAGPPGEYQVTAEATDRAGGSSTATGDPLTFACEAGGTYAVGGCVGEGDVDAELVVDETAAAGGSSEGSVSEEGVVRVRVEDPPDPSAVTLVAVGPGGDEHVLGQGAEATWATAEFENGYYRVEAREDGGGGDEEVELASTRYLVENPRVSLQEAVLAVAAGVFVAALAGAGAGGFALRWLAYLVKVVRRALGIEYRERTKETALRHRVLRQVAAAGVAAAVLGAAATVSGLATWDWGPFMAELPVIGGAAVAFSAVWYGGDYVLARLTGRTPRYVLLGSGLVSLAVTTLAFRSPFGTPGYVEKQEAPSWESLGEARERYEARRTLADLGVVASAGLLFAAGQVWWRYDFGSTGLLLVAMTLGTGAVPVPPLPNHKVWRWRPSVAVVVFAAGFGLYVGFQQAWIPAEAFAALAALGLAGVVLFVAAERRRGGPQAPETRVSGEERGPEDRASSRGCRGRGEARGGPSSGPLRRRGRGRW